jgi:hypothetical protein
LIVQKFVSVEQAKERKTTYPDFHERLVRNIFSLPPHSL